MNKMECVKTILQALTDLDARRVKMTATEDHRAVQQVYDDCMTMCKENGYVGKCADGLWFKAVRLRAINQGLHPDSPSYIWEG